MTLAIKPIETIADDATDGPDAMKLLYLQALAYLERLHRLLLDVIKDELERLNIMEINAVQALLLFNIGEAELTAGELKTRGYYQGSNVSYNLKKLVDTGYINHKRSDVDRRSVRVSLTGNGQEIADIVSALYDKHTRMLVDREVIDAPGLADLNATMRNFERFWAEQIRYRY